MDEPAEEISPFDVGHAVGLFDGSETFRYLKLQSAMRASPVVMLHIDPKDAIEMPRPEDQQPVLERLWARECWEAMAPYRTGAYVNWLMQEGDEHVREVYGEERYRRLQAVKRRYDPENVFHLNQNIAPG